MIDDVITMELNGHGKTVSFYKNGKSVEEMVNLKPLQYKLGIYLHSHRDYGKACITLEKFEVERASNI